MPPVGDEEVDARGEDGEERALSDAECEAEADAERGDEEEHDAARVANRLADGALARNHLGQIVQLRKLGGDWPA